jgi:hypothetical protein
MYNVEVLVRNTKKEAFELGLKVIALDEVPFNKEFRCNGYKIIENELFLSRYSDKCEKFPYEYNLRQTIDFAWGWYEANKKPTECEPDTDGSTEVAFELSTERCGVGSQDWGMFCSVKPIWFVYGK